MSKIKTAEEFFINWCAENMTTPTHHALEAYAKYYLKEKVGDVIKDLPEGALLRASSKALLKMLEE